MGNVDDSQSQNDPDDEDEQAGIVRVLKSNSLSHNFSDEDQNEGLDDSTD